VEGEGVEDILKALARIIMNPDFNPEKQL